MQIATVKSNFRYLLVRRISVVCAYVIGFALRRSLPMNFRRWFWKVAEDYINWRNIDVVARFDRDLTAVCNTADILQRYLIYFGVWEPHVTAFLRSRLNKGDIFIDIGANIGYYSMIASKSCMKVISIEASPQIFDILQKNIKRNRLENIRLVQIAVSDEIGKADIYLNSNNNFVEATLLPGRLRDIDGASVCTVDTAPLGQILEPNEMAEARLIKIDVEGAEYPILKSLIDQLDNFNERLEVLVELSPKDIESFGGTVEDILDMFAKKGYRPYRIENDYAEDEYLRSGENIRPRPLYEIPTEQVDVVFSRTGDLAS